ncbi:hypothetical protein EI42_03448 [Thermosporothrix hazakensis]|jgi:hypothetical protein|uniref:Uncharacterized protein n=2 Tax=Thermosporothrix TaxID=768650 RepID=A0A326U684_THEHA|nr:hypothetical protein [Thermosporothrix hazakensis]PZW28070.1 hypothetical protein EI42_03448 [Thermosporothrix hazakensis]BBH87002.1 hypothetical protein KTC_17530 [Thermosporothrix sp. COM3]GCE51291.1 hypothetical protein KTH_61600 [Thermosporothrix hazakensis]
MDNINNTEEFDLDIQFDEQQETVHEVIEMFASAGSPDHPAYTCSGYSTCSSTCSTLHKRCFIC